MGPPSRFVEALKSTVEKSQVVNSVRINTHDLRHPDREAKAETRANQGLPLEPNRLTLNQGVVGSSPTGPNSKRPNPWRDKGSGVFHPKAHTLIWSRKARFTS